MEFRYRATQQRKPPLLLPLHPLPPRRPLPANYIRVGDLVPGRQSMQELERELHDERIKEEIIARRIAQKRMLEDEARHDMEAGHRLMMMERYQAVRRHIPLTIMPPQHLASELEFDQRNPFHGGPAVEPAGSLALVPGTSNVETDSEVNLPDQKLTRAKRKADAIVSRPKDWSCALCQVSTTSEDALTEHLEGKKHQANAANLRSKNTSNAFATSQEKRGPRGGRMVGIMVNGKMHQVVEKGIFIWCTLCRVKCNSNEMMADHLQGKKHLAREASRNGEKSEVDN